MTQGSEAPRTPDAWIQGVNLKKENIHLSYLLNYCFNGLRLKRSWKINFGCLLRHSKMGAVEQYLRANTRKSMYSLYWGCSNCGICSKAVNSFPKRPPQNCQHTAVPTSNSKPYNEKGTPAKHGLLCHQEVHKRLLSSLTLCYQPSHRWWPVIWYFFSF